MKEYFREVLNWENKVETKEIREGLVNWLRNRLMLKLDHSTRKRDETMKKNEKGTKDGSNTSRTAEGRVRNSKGEIV